MTLMKYLTAFSGKEDPESWLDNYSAAAKAENWKDAQILQCVSLKLKKHAKEWYNTLSIAEKPKTWEQFVTIFLEEFGSEDMSNSIAECYQIRQKRGEDLKKYLNRFLKLLKRHDSAVKREVSTRLTKQELA
jgi:Retrotransposon gag protein